MLYKTVVFFSLIILTSCKPPTPLLSIKDLHTNSVSVNINDSTFIQTFPTHADSATFINLLPVFRYPADSSLKDFQPIQPGKYKLIYSTVTFIPDTPFKKGETYFLRFYQVNQGNNLWDIINKKTKLGTPAHTDLIFKP